MENEPTQRKLAERLSVLEEVFRSAPSFLHVLRGPELIFEFANEAYYRLVGRRDLIGRPAFEVLPEAAAGGFPARIRSVMTSCQPFFGRELPVLLARTPGQPPEQRLIDIVYLPLLEPDGTCTRVLGHGTDVTEHVQARQRAEQAQRASEEKFRRVVDSNLLGIFFWRRDGAVTDANQAFCDLLGCRPEEVRAGRVRWTDATPPELRERDWQAIEELNATGVCPPYEKEFLHRDGHRTTVLIGAAMLAQAPDQGVAFTIDLTQRKRLEAEHAALLAREQTARREAELARAQFRSIFESAPGAYLVVKPHDYEVVAVSDAYLRATMTQRADLLGRRLFDAFPDSPTEPHATGVRNLRASLQRVAATGQSDAMAVQRYPIPRPPEQGGGFEERWWSPINSPVLGPGGKVDYIIHRVEDVTSYIRARQREGKAPRHDTLGLREQRMEAELVLRAEQLQRTNEELRQSQQRQAALLAQLQAANRELNDFASIVAHDLKAPLRGVATLADWLQKDNAAQLDPNGRKRLLQMEGRVARLNRMIDEILQYSRLGRSEEHPEPVPLATLVPTVVRDLAPPAHVHIHLAPGLPVVQGAPVRLRQVFQNLLSNAIKYADKPRVAIQVTWAQSDSCWEFAVADNGPGIEAEHFERIFKMFQTLAPKDRTDSTGVGLALVKRIVEQAGGRIWVESGLGQGSTFRFTWPKDRAAGPATGTAPDAETPGNPGTEKIAA